MRKVKNLIVGCGLSGIVLAERLASQGGEEVLIIDRRNHIGGNIYDYKDKETGITVHQYGPHVFHTNDKKSLGLFEPIYRVVSFYVSG